MPSSQPLHKHVLDLPRSHYPVKVLQFGSGNFLRGFADWMIQEANRKIGFDAGVAVVQSISSNTTLQDQEGVYTVILKGIRDDEFVSEYFTIDVIQRIIYPAMDYKSFLEEALNPDLVFIISNTTEAGIQFLPSDNDVSKPAESFPAKLTQLLFHRFKGNLTSGLVILPTELIENNGTTLKGIVQQYASLWLLPPSFLTWLNENVTFCNTLVDRIVSGFPKKNKEAVFEEIGYKDELAVEAEWFHFWVIEGPRWIDEVLPLKKAGFNVVITNDLKPYQVRKVRILNGAHTSMALIGGVLGLGTVREALDHPLLGKFIRRMIYDDIVPHISGDMMELEKYADDVITRFRNPALEHRLEHIVLNSFSKYKVRVLPSILDNLERTGQVPERLAFTFAALLYYYRGHDNVREFKLNDSPDVMAMMKDLWTRAESSNGGIRSVCEQVVSHSYWGVDLLKYPQFVQKISQHLLSIATNGIMDGLRKLETLKLI